MCLCFYYAKPKCSVINVKFPLQIYTRINYEYTSIPSQAFLDLRCFGYLLLHKMDCFKQQFYFAHNLLG